MKRWIWTLALAVGGAAWASSDFHGPPPEAIEACSGLQENATCSVTFPDQRTVSGTCHSGPRGEAAACMPAGGPGGHHHGPPPEALQACEGAQSGARCSFTQHGEARTGTCVPGPQDQAAACMPANMPPPPADG